MSNRLAWDEAIGADSTPRKEGKRMSSRHAVLSKSMRVVDEETRKEVRDARLDALEADNYVEEVGEGREDSAYVESEDEERPAVKREVKRKRSSKHGDGARTSLIATFKHKNLAQWISEAGYDEADTPGPNYQSVAVGPSGLPPRHFCSVCGYWGLHTCTRCGMRFCSSKCSTTHKETRCLKFAV